MTLRAWPVKWRGSTVAGQRPRCGFHGWCPHLDVRFASRPKDASFTAPDANCNLMRLPASNRSGLVVGLRPHMPYSRVDEHLADLQAELRGPQLDQVHTLDVHRCEVTANWKLVSMLSYESYHFASLHREIVAKCSSRKRQPIIAAAAAVWAGH